MPSSLQCPEKADALCQSGGPGLQQAVMAVSWGSLESSGAHTYMAYVLVYHYNTSSTISLKAKENWDGFTPGNNEGLSAFDAKERHGLLDHVHRHLWGRALNCSILPVVTGSSRLLVAGGRADHVHPMIHPCGKVLPLSKGPTGWGRAE